MPIIRSPVLGDVVFVGSKQWRLKEFHSDQRTASVVRPIPPRRVSLERRDVVLATLRWDGARRAWKTSSRGGFENYKGPKIEEAG